MTKKKRLNAEQIIRKLPEAETMLAAGKSVGEVIQHLEVSEQTYLPLEATLRRNEVRRSEASERSRGREFSTEEAGC